MTQEVAEVADPFEGLTLEQQTRAKDLLNRQWDRSTEKQWADTLIALGKGGDRPYARGYNQVRDRVAQTIKAERLQ